jgi:hypothetical protein
MNYKINEKNELCIGEEIFHAWPHFAVLDSQSRKRISQSRHLCALLHSTDPNIVQWRIAIPDRIRRAVLRYPRELTVQLFDLAQTHDRRFREWNLCCPMMLVGLADYVCYRPNLDIDYIATNTARFLAMAHGWRQTLRRLDLPPTADMLRLLQDIPIEAATLSCIAAIRRETKLKRLHAGGIPEPPFCGETCEALKLHPLTSLRAIWAEGREMRNSLSSHIPQIIGRDCYAYQMIRPRRATILIRRDVTGWKLADIGIQDEGKSDTITNRAASEWLANKGGINDRAG